MRITLTLDDEVLDAAGRIATARGVSIGRIISELARAGLRSPASGSGTRNGIRLFPVKPGTERVTPKLVRTLLNATW